MLHFSFPLEICWRNFHNNFCTRKMTDQAVKVDPLGLAPCFGAGCMICSIFADFPECCGCSISGDVLCCNLDFSMCKRLEKEGECCAVCAGDVSIVSPTSLCKMSEQFFCLHCGVALPCDDDIAPCTLAIAGIVCCYKNNLMCGCCELRENLEKKLGNE